MADLRTNIPIPEDTWTAVIVNDTSGSLYAVKLVPGIKYFSFLGGLVGDKPVDGVYADTCEEVFYDSRRELFEYPSAAYLWLSCKGGAGEIIKT